MEETTTTNTTVVSIIETVRDWALSTGLKIVFAIIILLISFRIITVISRRIEKKLEKSGKFDKTLVRTSVLSNLPLFSSFFSILREMTVMILNEIRRMMIAKTILRPVDSAQSLTVSIMLTTVVLVVVVSSMFYSLRRE